MKAVLTSVLVAVIASILTTWIMQSNDQDNMQENTAMVEVPALAIDYDLILSQLDVVNLDVSPEPEAAAWIRLDAGTAQSEQKILAPAANSACFLTHVEVRGIQSPTDHNACTITLDDFTGYWQVNATTGEDTRSELFCNARCVIWE